MEKTIKIAALGDISLCDNKCPLDPFNQVRNYLETFDIVFGNLETVLTNETQHVVKRTSLRSDPTNVKYLKLNENILYNIANNHIMDYFVKGFRDTINTLKKEKLEYVGINQNDGFSNEVTYNINGVKVSFIGYGICRMRSSAPRYIASINYDKIITQIKRLKNAGSEIIIISIHDGEELIQLPHPKRQKISKVLIDQGAKVVLWHHAHVPQGIETYKKGVIAYSLGNFQFGPDEHKSQKWTFFSYILEICIEGENISYSITPIEIVDKIPYFPANNKKQILQHVNYLSSILRENSHLLFYSVSSKLYLKHTSQSIYQIIRKYPSVHSLRYLSWFISLDFWIMIIAYLFIPHSQLKKKYKNLYNQVYRNR